ARLLGAPLGRRVREVALPLARPAIAAGIALALMETLADYGVVSYFGVQTFTAGIISNASSTFQDLNAGSTTISGATLIGGNATATG
ncbi:MAG: ABC transporter permease subunit, partial [Tepidimonas sp.]